MPSVQTQSFTSFPQCYYKAHWNNPNLGAVKSMSFDKHLSTPTGNWLQKLQEGLCPEVFILLYSHISLHPSPINPTREEPDTNPQILLYPQYQPPPACSYPAILSVPIKSPCVQFTTKPKLQTGLTFWPCPTAHKGQVKLQGQSSSHQEIQQSTKAH